MADTNDSKILDLMLDPVTSELISLLEGGPKTVTEMSSSSSVNVDEIHSRLAPLVNVGLILRTDTQGDTTYSADADKLDAAFKAHNFDETINLVTQMDTYLN